MRADSPRDSGRRAKRPRLEPGPAEPPATAPATAVRSPRRASASGSRTRTRTRSGSSRTSSSSSSSSSRESSSRDASSRDGSRSRDQSGRPKTRDDEGSSAASQHATDSDSDASSVDFSATDFGDWKAVRRLTSGNNGQVYIGQPRGDPNGRPVALKVEKRSLRHSHLRTEVQVFDKLKDVRGFPRLIAHGKHQRTLWMAMELLGPSLRSLHDKYRFDEDLTVFLGEQMLDRLEALHTSGFVHLSVKPDNFCLRATSSGGVEVLMIDFGRCEKFVNADGRHITYKNNKGGPFSRWYHSAGALKGKRQSRRDDLHSLAYCLVLFTLGESFVDWREGLRDPAAVDVADHYRDKLPPWLHQFVRQCLDLEWAEAPDYAALRRRLRARSTAAGRASATDLCIYALRRHRRRLDL